MTIGDVARLVHEVNQAYAASLGEATAPWDAIPESRRQGVIAGVQKFLTDPGMTPEEQHLAWMEHYKAQGWTVGPRNDELKQHPCLVPYSELPESQRQKDYLFQRVVRTLAPHVTSTATEVTV